MEINQRPARAEGVRFAMDRDGREVARAYLYLGENDLHPGRRFGLLEDVFVEEDERGRGLGIALIRHVIGEARHRGCYKLVATSRHERGGVHEPYRRLGFEEWGQEFRLNFDGPAASWHATGDTASAS
jgi:GNAT superfamily N-acetyltransferase